MDVRSDIVPAYLTSNPAQRKLLNLGSCDSAPLPAKKAWPELQLKKVQFSGSRLYSLEPTLIRFLLARDLPATPLSHIMKQGK